MLPRLTLHQDNTYINLTPVQRVWHKTLDSWNKGWQTPILFLNTSVHGPYLWKTSWSDCWSTKPIEAMIPTLFRKGPTHVKKRCFCTKNTKPKSLKSVTKCVIFKINITGFSKEMWKPFLWKESKKLLNLDIVLFNQEFVG